MSATIRISCNSCRLCKRDQLDKSICKYKTGHFIATYSKPCENWLPSKPHIRIEILRHSENIRPYDNKLKSFSNSLTSQVRELDDLQSDVEDLFNNRLIDQSKRDELIAVINDVAVGIDDLHARLC